MDAVGKETKTIALTFDLAKKKKSKLEEVVRRQTLS